MPTNNLNSPIAIEMKQITKKFNDGNIIANNQIDLQIKRNEIHAIIGENGAGKSTLMSILFGLYKPTSGQIFINNEEVDFNSAQDAAKYKLGMVHQHFKLVDIYSLFENIIMGSEPNYKLFGKYKTPFIDRKAAYEKLIKIMDKYNFYINLDLKVENASVGEQQKTEILKLLYRGADTLIFDEPTAVLSDKEITSFLEILKEFKKEGRTIILITHKLNEVKKIADRGTVIRLGKVVGNFNVEDVTTDEMAEMMVGKKVVEVVNTSAQPNTKDILRVKDLIVTKENSNLNAVNLASFAVKEGEIFAIAGVEGNGQSEIAHALTGLIKPKSGLIEYYDSKQDIWINLNQKSIKYRNDNVLSHVPEDRHKHGLLLDFSCNLNAITSIIDEQKFGSKYYIKYRNIMNYGNEIIEKYDVRGTNRGKNVVRALSGGNQQKLIIGREMVKYHKIIVMVQPTRGLDLGAIQFIHDQILQEKLKGNSVILISYELDEIFKLADTIAVMNEGKIVACKPRNDISRKEIGQFMGDSMKEKENDFSWEENFKFFENLSGWDISKKYWTKAQYVYSENFKKDFGIAKANQQLSQEINPFKYLSKLLKIKQEVKLDAKEKHKNYIDLQEATFLNLITFRYQNDYNEHFDFYLGIESQLQNLIISIDEKKLLIERSDNWLFNLKIKAGIVWAIVRLRSITLIVEPRTEIEKYEQKIISKYKINYLKGKNKFQNTDDTILNKEISTIKENLENTLKNNEKKYCEQKIEFRKKLFKTIDPYGVKKNIEILWNYLEEAKNDEN